MHSFILLRRIFLVREVRDKPPIEELKVCFDQVRRVSTRRVHKALPTGATAGWWQT